jgi:hypothetical protein
MKSNCKYLLGTTTIQMYDLGFIYYRQYIRQLHIRYEQHIRC